MRQVGELLEAHVRLEERELFPLIERLLGDVTGLLPPKRDDVEAAGREQAVAQMRGLASDELNATLVSWNAGNGPPEHVNEERDVLVVVLDGSATVRVDNEEQSLARGEMAIIAKGRRREITAGGDGVRYLSVHRRRPPLQIRRAAEQDDGHRED
jgi:quercetin dioxygenase-like cupin family protein